MKHEEDFLEKMEVFFEDRVQDILRLLVLMTLTSLVLILSLGWLFQPSVFLLAVSGLMALGFFLWVRSESFYVASELPRSKKPSHSLMEFFALVLLGIFSKSTILDVFKSHWLFALILTLGSCLFYSVNSLIYKWKLNQASPGTADFSKIQAKQHSLHQFLLDLVFSIPMILIGEMFFGRATVDMLMQNPWMMLLFAGGSAAVFIFFFLVESQEGERAPEKRPGFSQDLLKKIASGLSTTMLSACLMLLQVNALLALFVIVLLSMLASLLWLKMRSEAVFPARSEDMAFRPFRHPSLDVPVTQAVPYGRIDDMDAAAAMSVYDRSREGGPFDHVHDRSSRSDDMDAAVPMGPPDYLRSLKYSQDTTS